MKKKIIVAVLVAVVLAFVGWGISGWVDNRGRSELAVTANADPAGNLYISPDNKLVSYDGVAGETALATLRRLTVVEVEVSDFGEFVTTINGLAADSSKAYWAFYVNSQMAAVGAGSYKAVLGDKLEWRLEAY